MSLPSPPLRRDGPTLFADRGDAFMAALPLFETEMVALGATAVIKAAAAATSEANALLYADRSAASERAAGSYSTAQLWSAPTNYAAGTVVYSPVNQRVYRRKSAGVSPTDPSGDGTNWGIASIGPTVVQVTLLTHLAAAGFQYMLSAAGPTAISLPAAPAEGDEVWVSVNNGLESNSIKPNGKLLMGLTEDLWINNPLATVRLRYLSNNWRIV